MKIKILCSILLTCYSAVAFGQKVTTDSISVVSDSINSIVTGGNVVAQTSKQNTGIITTAPTQTEMTAGQNHSPGMSISYTGDFKDVHGFLGEITKGGGDVGFGMSWSENTFSTLLDLGFGNVFSITPNVHVIAGGGLRMSLTSYSWEEYEKTIYYAPRRAYQGYGGYKRPNPQPHDIYTTKSETNFNTALYFRPRLALTTDNGLGLFVGVELALPFVKDTSLAHGIIWGITF